MHAPIILFVFRRPKHTRRTVEALQRNHGASKSKLFIYSDAPRKEEEVASVNKVRSYIDNIKGFKEISIIKQDSNKGLNNSILEGVSEIINLYERAIVVEDDIVTSPAFLRYMNDGLDFYQDNPKIWTITGFNYPKNVFKIPKEYKHDIFFNVRFSAWGWATWKNVWNKLEWDLSDFPQFIRSRKNKREFKRKCGDDQLDSLIREFNGLNNYWDSTMHYNQFKNNTFTVWPINSLVDNIGLDGTGHNGSKTYPHWLNANLRDVDIKFPSSVEINSSIMEEFRKIHKHTIYNKAVSLYFKLKGDLIVKG